MDELQKLVEKVSKENEWETPEEELILGIQEELGEIAGRYLMGRPRYGKINKNKESIPKEVGDLLFLLLSLANKYNISAETSLKNTLVKCSKHKKT